ncbi:MAG: PAS domain S-box protein [Planctomycetota bacterium]|jgi:PAS domain S-box-containing protein
MNHSTPYYTIPIDIVRLCCRSLPTAIFTLILFLPPLCGGEPTKPALTPAEQAWLKAHPVIRVGSDPAWAPIEWRDEHQQFHGIAIDYLRTVEARLGIRFQLDTKSSWQSLIQKGQKQEVDLFSCITQTPERKTFLRFTQPYLSFPIKIFVRQESGYVGNLKALTGDRTAVVRGYAIEELLRRNHPAIQVVTVKTIEEGLNQLRSGQVDAFVGNFLTTGYAMAKGEFTALKVAGDTPYSNDLGMGVRKDWPILVDILQKTIGTLSESERESLYRRWVPLLVDSGSDTTLAWTIGVPLLLILLLVLLLNRRLKAEVATRAAHLLFSEERYRRYFSLGLIGMATTSLEKGWVEFNDALPEMFGYNRTEFQQLTWSELTHPDDLAPDVAQFERVLAGEINGYTLEKRFLRKDGSVLYAEISAQAIRKGDGTVDHFVAMVYDLSERAEAKAALQKRESLFHAIFENMSTGVAVYTAINDGEDFIFKDINQAGTQLGELSREEHLGRSVRELYPAVKKFGLFAVLQEVYRSGRPQHFPMAIYEDECIQLRVENYVCKLPGGEVVAIYEDVTDRLQTAHALQESEQRARGIIDSIADPMIMMDQNLTITWANESAKQIFGDPVGQTCHAFFHHNQADPCTSCAVLKTMTSKASHEIEAQIQDREGYLRTFWCTTGVAMRNREGAPTLVVEILRDITERLEAEEKRLTLEQQLRQSEKMQAIGQLAGGVAHDFNNQLAGVLGYADILQRRLDDPKLQRYAANIRKAAKRSADLTEQLLAFSRKGKNLVVPVDLNLVLDEVLSILEHSLDKRITIAQHLKARPSTTLGDPTQLQNVFLNLAINARDAMKEGGTLTFESALVQLDAKACSTPDYDIVPGPYIHIGVTDTGTGIPEDILCHIFEPFFTTKLTGQGTGMGLASAYGTVRNHRGAITVDSEPGRGTTVHVYLPPILGVEESTGEEDHPALIEGAGHVLLVDDEEVVREIGTDMLQELGYSVTVCHNGREALERYRSDWQTIDLVMLDMVMPELNGNDTFLEMKKINPSILAILSSGYTIEGEAQSILDAGAKAFVGKPFDQSELSVAIHQVLGQESTD